MLLLKTVPVVMMLAIAETMPPLGYQKIENAHQNTPTYEYQYDIKNDKGVGQGKTEIGDDAGRYYDEEKNSSQSVQYVPDDWGYHPYVEFQNNGPFSHTITQMIKKNNNAQAAVNQDQINKVAAPSPQPNYIPLQNNQDDNKSANEETAAPEYVQEYLPAANEPNTLPQADYPYLDQNPKFVYLQNIENDAKNAVLLQPVLYDQILPVNHEPQYQNVQNYETVPLYENLANNVFQPKKAPYYEPIFHHPGGYGTRIHNKNRIRPHNMRFLNHVKDLISGQDVLDINTSVNTKIDGENQQRVEATPVLANAEVGYQRDPVTTTEPASTLKSTETGNTNSQSFLEQPIVVKEADSEDQTTVVVTPRPISNALLTPLTATVKLKPVSKIEDSKPIHQNYVVDVQRSIPFYLGKIEYYDNTQNKEKNVTATATQHIRLGSLLQQPIIEKTKTVPNNKALSANLSQSYKPKIGQNESLQSFDNSKYVAQETKIVEHPILLTVPHSADKNVEPSVTKSFDRYIANPVINKSIVLLPPPQVAEKKSPVPEYIETPVPVEKIAGDSGSYFGHRPYPVTVQVPVTSAFYLPIEISKPYPVELAKLVIPTAYSYPGPQSNLEKLPPTYKNAKRLKNQEPNQDRFVYTNYLQSYNKVPCIDLRLFGVRKPYCPKMNNNHYIGLVPPKAQAPVHYNTTNNVVRKQRTAREGLLDNIRWEYGFMPPLIPSLAIDENGNPVDKHAK